MSLGLMSKLERLSPFEKFHILMEPSDAPVISLLLDESKQPQVSLAFPWAGPYLLMSLPVSISQTAMKPLSSAETSASN